MENKPKIPPPPIKLPPDLAKQPMARLAAGVGAGWITGFMSVRVGRVPVALLGTSIILFQAAKEQGLIKHSWSDVNAKAEELKQGNKTQLQKVKKLAADNPAFTAGFTGGFLLGLIS